MTDPIQIGIGNRKVDRLVLKFLFGLTIIFLLAAFFKLGWLLAAGVSLVLAYFHRERIASQHYIYFQGDHFIIRHAVDPDIIIKKEKYMEVSKSWATSAFSTELSISFTDGRKFLFAAGDNRTGVVDKAIRDLINTTILDL